MKQKGSTIGKGILTEINGRRKVGRCPVCGKEVSDVNLNFFANGSYEINEDNPGNFAYCNCFAFCEKCHEPLLLLHRLKGKDYAPLDDAFKFEESDIGVCTKCLTVSRRMPVLVELG